MNAAVGASHILHFLRYLRFFLLFLCSANEYSCLFVRLQVILLSNLHRVCISIQHGEHHCD